MQIGPHHLATNVILAPMAGVTDLPFRRLCRAQGAGLAVSEMVSANASLWGSHKTQRRLDFSGEPGPISVQILGADPRQMAEAARVNLDHGADIIDINMGCPAKKVCKTASGAALMRDEALAARIMEAVVAAVPVPVTLKIRTGWDPQHRNGLALARIAEACGIQALAVHGRTRECGYSGQAEMDSIRQIKSTVGIPVVANGDIDSPQRAAEVLRYTAADGVMIGRAARGRPWLFHEITHYLEHGTLLPPRTSRQILASLRSHLEALYAFYGERLGVRVARKHIAWYSRGLRDGGAFRAAINAADSSSRQLGLIDRYFAAQEELTA